MSEIKHQIIENHTFKSNVRYQISYLPNQMSDIILQNASLFLNSSQYYYFFIRGKCDIHCPMYDTYDRYLQQGS